MLERIYRIAETIKVERVVLNALASAEAGFVVNSVAAASDENCAFGDFSHRLRRSRSTAPILAACESL
jgi:hypothetical protein